MNTTRRTVTRLAPDEISLTELNALVNHYRRNGSKYQVQQAESAFDAVRAGATQTPVVQWACDRLFGLMTGGAL
jgi:hypothetical protein